jgi:hypothetical protein
LGAAVQFRRDDEIVWPILFCFAGSITLFALLYYQPHTENILRLGATYWVHELPPDNEIPFLFAERLRAGGIDGPILGDWLSSDRPPLQTGVTLMAPMSALHLTRENYQAIATALQLTVLLGVWTLVRSFAAARIANWVTVAALLTPITLVNATFVWPKLAAASFLLSAIAVYFYRRPETALNGLITGTLCALAVLTHGASAFMLIGMGTAAIALWRIPTLRFSAAALVALVLLYAPWSAYQSYVDPPGNRLTKWHLAGVMSIDTRGTVEAIVDEYGKLTSQQIIDTKLDNARMVSLHYTSSVANTLAGLAQIPDFDTVSKTLLKVRTDQFFGVLAATGLLGFIFWLIPLGWALPLTRPLAAVLTFYFIAWWALLFTAGSAVTHVGSYAAQMGLVSAAGFLCQSLRKLGYGIIVAHCLLTLVQYAL